MGWFLAILCWFLRIRIFVPEWGWVSSICAKNACTNSIFSSPLGDGLVPYKTRLCRKLLRFSSPSGDGLVLNAEKKMKVLRSFCPRLGMGWFTVALQQMFTQADFRPRVGMGWFTTVIKNSIPSDIKFSSPSGDGLVPHTKWHISTNCNFRPRVGMGWFQIISSVRL